MNEAIRIEIRPHMERGGFHLDRFEAWIGDELLCVSRSPEADAARKMLGNVLYSVQGRDRVIMVAPSGTEKPEREIGAHACESWGESDKQGIRRHEWVPHPLDGRAETVLVAEKLRAWRDSSCDTGGFVA